MKKFLIIALAAVFVATVYAAPKADSTKAEFTAQQKERFEKNGWSYDQSIIDEIFRGIDTDGDGVATGVEKKAYWGKISEQKSSASSPAQKAPKAPTRKLETGDSTLETYIEFQKTRWDKNGWNWNVAKVKQEFHAIDANKDGIATGLEKKAYWDNWSANK